MTSPAADWPPPSPGHLLEAAYAEHAPACRLYAGQIVGPAWADDAAQEAFIRLFRHLRRENAPPRAMRAWLMSATRSAALDLLRSERRRAAREEAVGRAMPFVAGPEDRLEAAEVAAGLSELPQRQREAVVLRIWGGLGFAEIAGVLEVAISTAHAEYTAGLADLRRRMEGGGTRNAPPAARATGP